MKKVFQIATLLLIGFGSAKAQPAFIKDSLGTYINREMQRWQVPGLAIAIVKDGKIVHVQGYGVRDIDSKIPVDAYTLFQIASNSKAFTGTAIAHLHQQKKINLDAKVKTYMPSFSLADPMASELSTVRDLLCHRIGFGTFQGDFMNWGSNLTRAQIIEGMGRTKAKHPFRYTYGYCNAAYITAGELIPIVTGKSWDQFIKDNYFNPLNMKHTNSTYAEMASDKNACTPHTLVQNKLVRLPLTNIDNMGPSASINSCAADMANWLLMQLDSGRFEGKEIVPFSVLKETRKSHMIVNDVNSKIFTSKHFVTYGLGWSSYDYMGKRVWEHSGGANGFVTKTEFIPEANLGVLVYTNTDANSLYDALVKQVIEAYLNVPYRNLSAVYYSNSLPSKTAHQKDLDSLSNLAKQKIKTDIPLAKYVGTYQNDFYGAMEIKLEKGTLKMYLSKHPNNIGTLSHIGNNKFLCVYSDLTCGIEVLPFTVENNEVKSIQVKVADFIDYEKYEFIKQAK
ncbi:MAG: serine hydrolase [Bacteroidia bacterium]|nr:serine hydrolase [Bacteroidia bacterium]